MENIFIRIIRFLVGIFILTFGVALQINTNLGIGCWDSVNVGLHNLFSLSVGTFAFLVGVMMVIIAGIIRKGKFNVFTLITAFFMGSFTDFSLWLVSISGLDFSGIMKYIFLFLGIILAGMGLALYLLSDLPPNSIDDCSVAIKEKFNLNIGVAKLLLDITGIFIALLVQGPIGIGTIFITLLVGPFVTVFDKIWRIAFRTEEKK